MHSFDFVPGCSSGQFHPSPSSCTLLGTNQDAALYKPPASKLEVSPCLGWVMELRGEAEPQRSGRFICGAQRADLAWPLGPHAVCALPWLPALAFLFPHIIPLQLLGKTVPAATSIWKVEGEPPMQHEGSVGAGSAAGLGNAGFFPPGSSRSGR